MALSCGGHCMKIMLFIFNGIFFLGGAAMLGIGIWLLVDDDISSYFEHIIPSDDTMFKASAITMCVVGGLIFVIGFFGCCGAIRENTCMLCTFVILISFIFALEIVVAVLAGVFHSEIGDAWMTEMSKQARTVVMPLKEEENNATSYAWHQMQYDLQCCGGANYTDYKYNPYFNKNSDNPVPKTCCMLKDFDDLEDAVPVDYDTCVAEFNRNEQNPTQLWNTGCYNSLVNWLDDKAVILIAVAISIAVIQILGITFACCVRNQLNRKQEYNA